VLTIQERWRFESIPNQLVIYSSHKPHSPIKWATDHQWYFLGKCRGITIMDYNTQGASWLLGIRTQPALGLTFRALVIPPSVSVCQSEFIPAQNVALASRSKGTLFGQLNVRHAFNMTRGTSNNQSLTETDRKLIAPRTLSGCLQLFYPISNYPSTYGYFQDIIHFIAKVF
jgi:hypothetical protein